MLVGQEIDQYRIVRLIGEGGMGQVFEAVDGAGGRAAIKVLRAEYVSDSQMSARFLNEARAIRLVEHPGVVTIFAVGVLPTGAAYIAMEYLIGRSLREHMRDATSLRWQPMDITHQVAMTLAAVHARKIVHRDLKPENIILTADPKDETGRPRAKVLDFGIAKLAAASQAGAVKTQTGVLIGTPTYMAPEQCGAPGEICDRTDVYALGVMLYEMLTGRPPFEGEQDSQIIGQQLFMPPQQISELLPSIAPRLATLVHRMLAKAPAERPAMRLVASELEQLQRNNSTEFRLLPTALFGLARPALAPREHISTLTQATGQTPPRRLSERRLLVGAAATALLLGAMLPQALKALLPHSGSARHAAAKDSGGEVPGSSVSRQNPSQVDGVKPDPGTKPPTPALAPEVVSVPAPALAPAPTSAAPAHRPPAIPTALPTRRTTAHPAAHRPPLSETHPKPAEPPKPNKNKLLKDSDVTLFR